MEAVDEKMEEVSEVWKIKHKIIQAISVLSPSLAPYDDYLNFESFLYTS